MSVKLNEQGYEHAQRLVREKKVVLDARDQWSEHQPSTEDENRYLRDHGIAEYGKWHLGIDSSAGEDTKGRYSFPYGDFVSVHRSGVIAAEARAGQYHHQDIELAAAHLHGMLDELG